MAPFASAICLWNRRVSLRRNVRPGLLAAQAIQWPLFSLTDSADQVIEQG